jgi:DnaJ-domain-containing protein 1
LPWGTKKQVLRRFTKTAHLQSTEIRHALQDLVVAATRREHQCEDQGYGRLARVLDGMRLRSELNSAAHDNDPLVRLRACFVLWVLDHRDTPAVPRTWKTWLAATTTGES